MHFAGLRQLAKASGREGAAISLYCTVGGRPVSLASQRPMMAKFDLDAVLLDTRKTERPKVNRPNGLVFDWALVSLLAVELDRFAQQ